MKKQIIALSLIAALAVTFTACDDGKDGTNGTNGTNGIDGTNGTNGENGQDGVDGTNGTNGTDGQDGADGDFNSSLSISFKAIPTPTGDAQKSLQVSSKATVNGQTETIGYTKLMATGDSDNSEMFGLVKDMNDNVLTMDDGNPYICNGTSNPAYSGSGLDFVSILQKNSKLYMVSQFECQVGAMYVNELEQDATTGELSAKAGTLEFISQKDEFGGYVHCAGQKTPWESYLGSEEYPPNARSFETDSNATSTGDTYFETVLPYWGGATPLS